MFGWELCLMGVAGMYYCYQPASASTKTPPAKHQVKPKREVVSVSDYVTITSMGLLMGNFTGWAATSVVVFCKAVVLGS